MSEPKPKEHHGVEGLEYKESRMNKLGNQVDYYYDGSMDRSRYSWDGQHKAGWLQYDTDQDAIYFGDWVNKQRLQIRTYCEGDFSVVTCPDADHFDAQLVSMDKCYGKSPFASTMDEYGNWTEHFESRDIFFIGEPPVEKTLSSETPNG